MMKTVTVCCYRRPDYTDRCLNALAECRGVADWQVVLSIDAPRADNVREGVRGVYDVAERMRYAPPLLGMMVHRQPVHLGVAEHPKWLYDTAFESCRSEFNVAIEDDCVLSPDALELADWYEKLHQGIFISLGDERKTHQDQSVLLIRRKLTSPHSWAFNQYCWRYLIRPNWNCKKELPTGWDWSLTYTMAVNGWTALAPAESRSLNIGREAGEHAGAEGWDATWVGATASDGSYSGPYQIEDGNDERWQDWMTAELPLKRLP